ncbi:MAG: tRNA (adenosine(37)-N6)-dimethylallyltransferase MiaA [Planctomycetota bacterium]
MIPIDRGEADARHLVWVVTGPTAGGKASLALKLARRFGVPIISLDSMKVYRGMDVGTAKPSADLVRSVPFHLIDIRDPWESFSVGDYVAEVSRLTATLSRPWLFSGGTPFYLHALLTGLSSGPPAQPDLRARLADEVRTAGLDSLYQRLLRLDPIAGGRIHPADRRRILRALEVIETTGRPFSDLLSERTPFLEPGRYRLLGIARSRAEQYRRIDARVVRMFDDGWVAEVETLRRRHDPPWGAQASQSIGYEEVRDALEKREEPRDRIPKIQTRTRHFARSQLTWFRKMPIEWWTPEEESELVATLERDLADAAAGKDLTPPAPARRVCRDQ